MTPADPPVHHLVLVPSGYEQGLLSIAEREDLERFACGIGPVAAALETALLLARRKPGHCWLVGLAGSRDGARVPVGTVLVGTAVVNQAVGAGAGAGFVDLAGMGLDGDGQGQPDRLALAVPGGAALDAARAALTSAASTGLAALDPTLALGVVGTVAAASADAAAAEAWARRHPDVAVEEMEGWAVALACRRAGVPLTILRGVGNLCGDRQVAGWRSAEAMQALDLVLAALLDGHGAPVP